MRPPRPIARFLEGPSVRNAIRVIVAATIVITFVGGVLVWVLDRKDFPSFGSALWWALQTVTTVGYGDITPVEPIGRLIGAAVLLYSVAFLAILTALITTSFTEHRRREMTSGEADPAAIAQRLDGIADRLERLERLLSETEPAEPPST